MPSSSLPSLKSSPRGGEGSGFWLVWVEGLVPASMFVWLAIHELGRTLSDEQIRMGPPEDSIGFGFWIFAAFLSVAVLPSLAFAYAQWRKSTSLFRKSMVVFQASVVVFALSISISQAWNLEQRVWGLFMH